MPDFSGYAALSNIVYDGVNETANMGAIAILITAATAAVGTVLVREGKRQKLLTD